MSQEIRGQLERIGLLPVEIEKYRRWKWERRGRGVADRAQGRYWNFPRGAGAGDPFRLHVDRGGAVLARQLGAITLALDHARSGEEPADSADEEGFGTGGQLGGADLIRR